MVDFEKIYLSWKREQGSRRILVGVIEYNESKKLVFSYIKDGVNQAKAEGFAPYTEFSDTNKIYNGNFIDIFGQRLTKHDRPDIHYFYDFWEIDSEYREDKLYMLAHTQGLLATDNFEFLADYKAIPGLHFLTEIASLSVNKIPPSFLHVGDVLDLSYDPTNEWDDKAVKVAKNGQFIGFIKKVHSRVFYKADLKRFQVVVKAVEKNGYLKRVFLKVEFSA